MPTFIRRALRLTLTGVSIAVMPAAALAEPEWPMALKSFGGGYPKSGAPCSRVEENSATAEFIAHDAILIACPASRSSVIVRRFLQENGGRAVGEVEGFALISVPSGGANGTDDGGGGTTSQIACVRQAAQRMGRCSIEVVRKSNSAAVVHITHSDGSKRTIYFANGRVSGADIRQVKGTPRQSVTAAKELDMFAIGVGDERYEVPISLVFGN